MIRGPLTAAVVAGLVAFAACGTEDAEPVVEVAAPAPAPASAVGVPDGHPGYVYSGGRPQLTIITPVRW
jgi:hypothetical protein